MLDHNKTHSPGPKGMRKESKKFKNLLGPTKYPTLHHRFQCCYLGIFDPNLT